MVDITQLNPPFGGCISNFVSSELTSEGLFDSPIQATSRETVTDWIMDEIVELFEGRTGV